MRAGFSPPGDGRLRAQVDAPCERPGRPSARVLGTAQEASELPEPVPGVVRVPRDAARFALALEHGDRGASASEHHCGREPGGACANDRDIDRLVDHVGPALPARLLACSTAARQ